MDYLWTPWRYQYISGLSSQKPGACVLCDLLEEPDDQSLVVYRGIHNYIVLNRFPYTSGHSMVVPFRHFGVFSEMTPEEGAELLELTSCLQRAMDVAYRPEGYNLGWNQGKCAGAGVAGHLHLHVIPRWVGDTNMVSALGETRVLPEDLSTTYRKLKEHFKR